MRSVSRNRSKSRNSRENNAEEEELEKDIIQKIGANQVVETVNARTVKTLENLPKS